MITVNIKGGLGNQMFQYACGRALALKRQVPLKILKSHYRGDPARDFSLTKFNIKAEILPARKAPLIAKLTNRLKQKVTGNFHVGFDQEIADSDDGAYLDGYFQSPKYFADYESAIREDFTLAAPLTGTKAVLYDMIKNAPEATAVHVRRGDYLNHPEFGGIANLAYLERAAARLGSEQPNASFFVFSDDIKWCEENLKFLAPATFVSNPELTDYEELTLMSAARHHIISNSSFSWWGAWLAESPGQIVIAPATWSNIHDDWYQDIIPDTWIRL